MSDTSAPEQAVTWEPVDDGEAADLIGEGIHTGLRKGSEAPSSHDLWKAISDSTDGAWSDALQYLIGGLDSMGYRLCQRVDPTE